MLACRVFKPALIHLQLSRRSPHLRIDYVPSYLHIAPRALEDRLRREIRVAEKKRQEVTLLYGECFPDMQHFCQLSGVHKIPCLHCYQILLGHERFQRLMDQEAGTFFVESDLITHFKEYCLDPLELHDQEMRYLFFGNYKKLLYVRQPGDPDLTPEVESLAGILQLTAEIQDADYSHLERELAKLGFL